jgi:hypothetical protein
MARAIAAPRSPSGWSPFREAVARDAGIGRISFILSTTSAKPAKQQFILLHRNEIVHPRRHGKGYEFEGQYVTFTPDELKSLEEKATASIDIAEFVAAGGDRFLSLRPALLPRS